MFNLFIADFYKKISYIKNNKFHFLMGILFNVLIVLIMYFRTCNNDDSNMYFYLILIYAIIWLVFSALTQSTVLITDEIKHCTINNLILSPYGLKKILYSRLLCESLVSMIVFMFIFFFATVMFKVKIHINILVFTLLIFWGLISIYSIGIILGFLSLISKNINLLVTLIKLAILYSVAFFNENIFIPFSFTKALIIDIIIYNESLYNFDNIFFLGFFLNSILYFLASHLFSSYIEVKALKEGKFLT